MLNLAQAIVLNVAINSFNKALLTIMISNQVSICVNIKFFHGQFVLFSNGVG